jgi:hypothetical protein
MGENVLRSRYGSKPPDEVPVHARPFFGIPTPDWLLVGGSVRSGIQFLKPAAAPLKCSHFDDAGCKFLEMEADLKAQFGFERFRAYGSLGWMREGAAPTQITLATNAPSCGFYVGENGRGSPLCAGNLVSREHWVGVDLGADKQFLLRAGRIDIPYGLRNDEHDLLVRNTATTRTNINESQQHGVALYYGGEIVRGEVMALLGNYQLNPDDMRERGYAGYLEFNVAPKAAFGVSSMVTYAAKDYQTATSNTIRQLHGVFTRYSPHRVLVLMAEADAQVITAHETGMMPGVIGMAQADIEPAQGLHLVFTGEAMVQGNVPLGPMPVLAKSYDGWAGVLWFFAPHADVRADFVASSVANGAVTIYVVPQLHVYL